MRFKILFSFFLFTTQLAVSQISMVDNHCTAETRNLYLSLNRLSKKGVLFGHYNDNAIGIGWTDVKGRSDVKDVGGEYPAIFGFDLGYLERDKAVNIETVSLDKIKLYIAQAYNMGCIVTITWHSNNPVYPGETYRSTRKNTIDQIFSDSTTLKRYTSWLDKIAAYFLSLRGPKGELIPIIFRPFHESNGGWFWWGRGNVSADSYIKLWQYTVRYLRDTKNVHNLIYAFSPNGFSSEADYLETYPGDQYVDLLGFDYYSKANYNQGDSYVARIRAMSKIMNQLAATKSKVWAITETGFKSVPDSTWWTKSFLPAIKNSGAAYVMLWTNLTTSNSYCVYPGQISAPDFKVFHNSSAVIFANRVAKENVYGKTNVEHSYIRHTHRRRHKHTFS